MSVKEPKTRFTAALHQAIRVDQPQLMRTIELAFKLKSPMQKLWPMSPGTFRQRFGKIAAAFGLDHILKPLDWGSLRAGGATWLLQTTENGELVRRRGRWLNQKIMEIYVQEVAALQFYPSLHSDVMRALTAYPHVLAKAEYLGGLRLPSKLWYSFLAGSHASRKSVGDHG